MRVRAAHVAVKRKLAGLSRGVRHRKGRAQDGVGAHGALVVGAVDVQHALVDVALLDGIEPDQGVGDFRVDVVHRVADALAHVALGVVVAQLDGLESARRSPRRNRRPALGAVAKGDVDLYGWVAAGIQDLTAVHVDDDRHLLPPK